MSKISVPDIGDFKDVEVIDVLVKPGDTVALETPLITLETEKATMDVPATAAGRVKSVAVKKGDRVSKGSAIVEIEVEAEVDAGGAPTTAPQAPKPSPAAASTQAPAQAPAP